MPMPRKGIWVGEQKLSKTQADTIRKMSNGWRLLISGQLRVFTGFKIIKGRLTDIPKYRYKKLQPGTSQKLIELELIYPVRDMLFLTDKGKALVKEFV